MNEQSTSLVKTGVRSTESVKLFHNEKFHVRVVMIEKEPWFVAKDVADILGYDQTANMLKRLDDDEKISSKMDDISKPP